MFHKYLLFAEDKKNREKIIEELPNKCSEQDIQHALFCAFLSDNRKEDYDIDNCILLDFPLSFVARILNKFVLDEYSYAWGGDEEIAKLVYHLWPKYMKNQTWKNYNKTFPHNIIFNCLYSIRESLLEFDKINSCEDFNELRRKKNTCRYYNWHMFAFFPLLEDRGIPILLKVIELPYNDAQEMLMFGLAQYDPRTFLPHFEKILDHWQKNTMKSGDCQSNNFIHFESGTGIYRELEMIVKKYEKDFGVKVYENEKIKNILEYYEING